MPPVKKFTILDLIQKFPTEKACHQYLASQRWETGEIICPHDNCGHDRYYVFADGIRYKCKKCKIMFTAKTNTFMEASKLPTIKWILAMYLVLHKKGVSSIQLSKDIGVTQKTAWFMLQRIRVAFGNEAEEKLDGIIEIDETFVGGASKFKHKNKRAQYAPDMGWRTWQDKVPVMGVLRRQTKTIIERPHKFIPGRTVKEGIVLSPSYIKARVIENVKTPALSKAIRSIVADGATVMTDGYRGYNGFEKWYNIRKIDHSVGQYVSGDIYTNTVEGFWSQFKKGIKGVYHKTTKKHLQKYVDEFAFKYNKRNLGVQQQIESIITNMVCRLKYKDLIAS